MALFTDGPAATIEDLTAQDSQLFNVASSEGIDVTVKLELAYETIGMEVEELLRRGSSFGLSHVVVTPALRLWHTYRTLEFIYRDAYNSQLNDRYAGKRDQFHELSKWAYNRLLLAGVGVAQSPIPRAREPLAAPGTGAMPSASYYVAITWVNAAGEEGACSGAVIVEVTGGGFEVSPGASPANATGWNLYAGTTAETMTRQNNTPIDRVATWVGTALVEAGPQPGRGQSAGITHAVPRILQRG